MPKITIAEPLHGNVIRARFRGPTDHRGSRFLVDGPRGAPRKSYPYDYGARNAALAAASSYLSDLDRTDSLTLTPLPDGPVRGATYFLVSREED